MGKLHIGCYIPLIAWYLFIGIRFYSGDLQNLLARKGKINSQVDYNEFPDDERKLSERSESNAERTKISETEDLFKEAEQLTAKLKEAIADASFKNYNKEEFTFLLQLTLKEYPNLKGSPFQVAINNLIISECEKYGLLHLSAEELESLWKEVA